MTAASTLPFPAGIRLKLYGPLSSHEGLVNVMCDGAEGKDGQSDDEGVKDKRLPVVEHELGTLRAVQRPSNNLSRILRVRMTLRAYDGGAIPLLKHCRHRSSARGNAGCERARSGAISMAYVIEKLREAYERSASLQRTSPGRRPRRAQNERHRALTLVDRL